MSLLDSVYIHFRNKSNMEFSRSYLDVFHESSDEDVRSIGEGENNEVSPKKRKTKKKKNPKYAPKSCKLCLRTFTTRRQYDQHLYYERTTCKALATCCVDCEHKEFSTPSALRRHQKTHKNRYRYRCQHCVKTFTREDAVQRHMKNCRKCPKMS